MRSFTSRIDHRVFHSLLSNGFGRQTRVEQVVQDYFGNAGTRGLEMLLATEREYSNNKMLLDIQLPLSLLISQIPKHA